VEFIFFIEVGKVGLGHLNRCNALIHALLNHVNINVRCFISAEVNEEYLIESVKYDIVDNLEEVQLKEIKSDFFIVDSYLYSEELLEQVVNDFSGIVVAFDDYKRIRYNNCIVINGNIYAENFNYFECIGAMLGTKFLNMNKQYWDITLDQKEEYDLLITTGGSDDFEITLKLMEKTRECDKRLIIIGPWFSKQLVSKINKAKKKNDVLVFSPNGLKKQFEMVKGVVTSCGSTVYEVMRMQKKFVVFSYGEDQELLVQSLVSQGIFLLGDYNNIDLNLLDSNLLRKLPHDMVDGKGSERCANYLINWGKNVQ